MKCVMALDNGGSGLHPRQICEWEGRDQMMMCWEGEKEGEIRKKKVELWCKK
ncbi:hypothetical protein E2C01_097804 [Portunus trituberculatus]|uniref:Uncharacterized protein n=1 Tax=Portunus trituberculatus TaxID=210409 RepID=A0A5B7K6N0_PORTR|nr:hypothetical protein [Portunus trituberculatus]